MIDWVAIEAAIFEWIDYSAPECVSNTQIIWADQNVAQPAYPFITLKKNNLRFIEGGGAMSETRSFVNDDGDLVTEVRGIVEFFLTIRAHVDDSQPVGDEATNAFFLMAGIAARLDLPRAREILCGGDLVVIEQQPVLDISSTTNEKWVSRATTDIRFRTSSVFSEVVDYFDTVAIDGTCGTETHSFVVP